MPFDLIKEHESYLFCTDLEPDDIQAQLQFFAHLQLLHSIEKETVKRTVGFVVGEGHAPLKCMRQERLIAQYKAEGLINNNINSLIIEGYSTDFGPQQGFVKEGLEVLTQAEINQARASSRTNGETINKTIFEFISTHKKLLVVSLKPVVELLQLHAQCPTIFAQSVFAGTGSFNFRATFPKKPFKAKYKEAWLYETAVQQYNINLEKAQKKIITLIYSFKETYIYETFTATRIASTSELNAADFFTRVKAAPRTSALGILKVHIENWNEHLLGQKKADLPLTLQEISYIAKGKITESDIQIILDNVYVKSYKTLATEAIQNIYSALDKIKNTLGPNESMYVRLKRLVTKWKNMTEAGLQFVNADPGLIAAMTGACEEALEWKAVKLAFNGEHTTLIEPFSIKTLIFSYAPKGLSVEEIQKDDSLLKVASKQHFELALQAINRKL